MWALGVMFMIMGGMLLTGEYLCVEVAWRCMDYNSGYVTVGMSMLLAGLAAALADQHST